jgi:hypothetical protein
VEPVTVAALGAHLHALVVEVEVLDVDRQHLAGAGGGLIQQPPQRLLAHCHVVAASKAFQLGQRDSLGAVGGFGAPLEVDGEVVGEPAVPAAER